MSTDHDLSRRAFLAGIAAIRIKPPTSFGYFAANSAGIAVIGRN